MTRGAGSRRWRWIALAVGIVIVAAIAVPFVYIHFIEGPAPAKLSLSSTGSVGPAATMSQIDGSWRIASGSQAGYRVQEVLAGQNNTAVGRTSDVTGQLRIAGSTVTAAAFTVDLRTVKSDQSQRDNQFNGRI